MVLRHRGVRMDPFRGCIAVCVCGTIIVSVERRSSFCVFLFECLRARLCGGLVYTVPPKANNKKKHLTSRDLFLTFFQILTFYPPPIRSVRFLSTLIIARRVDTDKRDRGWEPKQPEQRRGEETGWGVPSIWGCHNITLCCSRSLVASRLGDWFVWLF